MSTHLKKTLKTKYDRKTILLSRAKTFLKKLQAKKNSFYFAQNESFYLFFVSLDFVCIKQQKRKNE